MPKKKIAGINVLVVDDNATFRLTDITEVKATLETLQDQIDNFDSSARKTVSSGDTLLNY